MSDLKLQCFYCFEEVKDPYEHWENFCLCIPDEIFYGLDATKPHKVVNPEDNTDDKN